MSLPGISPGGIPPFHEMDEYTFQDMCRDIFEEEPEVVTCNVYGVRGQLQRGVDLIAHRAGGDGVELSQCKCVATFGPADIRRVSDEFFDHWSYWSQKSVRRFVLIVACDLSNTNDQNEILAQSARFFAAGVDYEVWSGSTITNKLRPHPGIVWHYMAHPELWVKIICGRAPSVSLGGVQTEDRASILVDTAIVGRMGQLEESLSEEVEAQLESRLTGWREGRYVEAPDWIRDIKEDATKWGALAPRVKARILCFEGRVALGLQQDVVAAKEIADEAEALFPVGELPRLRAMIVYTEDGPEAALESLKGHDDIDSLNLRAAFLLELGRTEDALLTLEAHNDGSGENDQA